MLVDDLQNIVDTYVTDPATAGAVGGLDDLARLRVQIDRLEAAFTLGVAAADARGDMQATGRTAAEWVGLSCRRSINEAQRLVSFAKKLCWTDHVRAGFVSGALSAEQARMVTAVLTKRNVSMFAEHEHNLIGIAQRFNMAQFQRALQHWRKLADDFTAKNDAKTAEDARELFCSQVGDTFVLNGTLTAEQGTIVNEAITMISQAEWDGSNDPRTLAQRRADALTSICRYALDTNTTRTIHGSRPHIEVLVDLEDFFALGNAATGGEKAKYGGYTPAGTFISGVTLERICCDARISHTLREASQPEGANPIHVGRVTDTVPKHIRRAVLARDCHCRYPGCDRPAAWSEIHHVKYREHGGEHTVINLVLMCGRHHHRIHAFNETLVLEADGSLTVTSADGTVTTSHPPPNLNKLLKPKPIPIPSGVDEPRHESDVAEPILRARTNTCSRRNMTLTAELSALLEQHVHDASICLRAPTSRQLPNIPIDYIAWTDNGLVPVFHD
jgi:Domain of unknown function (DUF222)